jgi:hypothetical protein
MIVLRMPTGAWAELLRQEGTGKKSELANVGCAFMGR